MALPSQPDLTVAPETWNPVAQDDQPGGNGLEPVDEGNGLEPVEEEEEEEGEEDVDEGNHEPEPELDPELEPDDEASAAADEAAERDSFDSNRGWSGLSAWKQRNSLCQ